MHHRLGGHGLHHGLNSWLGGGLHSWFGRHGFSRHGFGCHGLRGYGLGRSGFDGRFRRAGRAQLQGCAGHEGIGFGQAVEAGEPLHGNAIEIGDFREGFTRHHLVLLGVAVHHGLGGGGARRAGRSWHLDPAAGPEVLGVLEAVELHQPLHGNAIALGNFGQGFAGFHRVVACAAAGRAAAGAGVTGTRHLDPTAGPEVLGVLEAVELHQPLHGNAIALGNFRQGFAGLHHHLAGQARQGQQQGENQGGSGAAHGGRRWAMG